MQVRRVAALSVVVALWAAGILAAGRRPITDADLYAFQWVAFPQISPDGRQAAYVLATVNEKRDGYETSLWIVPTTGAAAPRRLTAGPRDTAPRWSPDARTLAFLRSPGEKEKPQIFLLSLDGGDARPLTDLPGGATAPVWSPSGKQIAFTSGTTADDLEEQRLAKEKGKAAEKPVKSDVHVVTRAVFRQNGEGWLDFAHPEHVWTVPAGAAADGLPLAKPLTSGVFIETDPSWAADGSAVLFRSDRNLEPYYDPPEGNLYSVPAGGGEIQTVADIAGPILGAVASPDGKSFALTGSINPPQAQSYTRSDVFLYTGGRATALTTGAEYTVGSEVTGDQHPPRGGSRTPLVWTPDGRALLLVTTLHGRSNLVRLDVETRKIEPLTQGNHEVFSTSSTPDGSKMVLEIGDPTNLGDLFAFDVAARRLTQLTRHNEALLSSLELATPEEIWYPSFDGTKINAWLLKPPGFDPAKKFPLILEIHGGPHAAYGDAFFHEFQWMAAKGYLVLYTNPRGSTTYGQDFGNVIQYKYPGDDFSDLMAGVEQIVQRGYVDEKKLGVTGGSGGGLLTNWVVTQTNRFAAAVSSRSVADWESFWYTADFTLFQPTWFRGYPFQDPAEFAARSPVRYAEKIQTPLLLTVGERDERTPPGQGAEPMFRALKALKRPTAMIVFPGETHELSRSGQPRHRVERLQHILNWFDKYLMGAPVTLYDLPVPP